jgi:hypothetical protein
MKMTASKIHTYLDEGCVVNFNATGVTFPSVIKPNLHRQDIIKEMKEDNSKEISLIFETDNPYDDYAISIRYEGLDVGFVPKNTDIQIKIPAGKVRRVYEKSINQIMHEYSGELKAEIDAVFGGYDGKHLGFSVNVWKV